MTLPTADDVARAIVAAAWETGEDPVDCIRGVPGARCRHYAMHALIRLFPEAACEKVAQLVGCPGKAKYFYNNSRKVVLGLWRKPQAKWWNPFALQRVVEAIPAHRIVQAALQHSEPALRTGATPAISLAALPAVLPPRMQELKPPRPLRLPPSMQRAVDLARSSVPASLDKLNTRRRVVPAHDCENVTSELMGDPPPSRSALANR